MTLILSCAPEVDAQQLSSEQDSLWQKRYLIVTYLKLLVKQSLLSNIEGLRARTSLNCKRVWIVRGANPYGAAETRALGACWALSRSYTPGCRLWSFPCSLLLEAQGFLPRLPECCISL